MRGAALLLALLAFLSGPASAQEVVADLSQSRVSITTSFSGSDILVFGAVREPPPDLEAPPLPFDIIVTVSGPLEPVTVRRKSRVAGIWINTDSVGINRAPSLYKVASTAPLSEILSETSDIRHSITVPRAIRSIGASEVVADAPSFTEALIRIRTDEGVYSTDEGGVTLIGNMLFRANVDLPSNLTEGSYTARIFMMRDKHVVASYTDVLGVRKVGIERWIFLLAQDQAALYGLLSLAIAIAAGWGASEVFRYIRS